MNHSAFETVELNQTNRTNGTNGSTELRRLLGDSGSFIDSGSYAGSGSGSGSFLVGAVELAMNTMPRAAAGGLNGSNLSNQTGNGTEEEEEEEGLWDLRPDEFVHDHELWLWLRLAAIGAAVKLLLLDVLVLLVRSSEIFFDGSLNAVAALDTKDDEEEPRGDTGPSELADRNARPFHEPEPTVVARLEGPTTSKSAMMLADRHGP